MKDPKCESYAGLSVVFVDARDTLGEVDRPGHMVPYRPSTEKLLSALQQMGLRIGVITNLPDDVSADEGKDMIVNAVLSEDSASGRLKTIGDYIRRQDVVTNHEAKTDKPARAIYEFAAKKLGVTPGNCLFLGENLVENLGASLAGMRHQLKPCPPGREFLPSLQGKLGASPVDSGRQFEAFLEHEHLLGERIFACGEAIGKKIGKLIDGKAPPLNRGKWISPKPVKLPEELRRAIAHFVHLIEHFADQVHLRAEELMIEVAIACGMDPKKGQWVLDQHEQARAYWAALEVAWRRIQNGDPDDRFYALQDFKRTIEAFVILFKAHAVREDNQLYPTAGKFFSDADDALVLNLIMHSGPSDVTPYVGMVERMEGLLGISK